MKSKGGYILNKLVTNPIDRFEFAIADLATQVTAQVASDAAETTEEAKEAETTANAAKGPDEAEAKSNKTPQSRKAKQTRTSVNATVKSAPNTVLIYPNGTCPGAPRAPTDEEFKENPQTVALDFYNEVRRTQIGTSKMRQGLKDYLLEWTNAEAIIYAVAIQTLVNAPHFIIPTEAQAEHN